MKALILILCLAGEGSDAASPAREFSPVLRVLLRETAQVKGVRFHLGEAVQIEGEDAERVAKARAIPVGYSPNPGFERKIRREAIADLLAGAGFSRSELRWEGEKLVSVSAQAETISSANLTKIGEQFLVDYLSELGLRDFQIVLKGAVTPLTVPAGREGVQVEPEWRGGPKSSGQALLDLRVLVDGEFHSLVPASYAIRHYGVAASAARFIGIGERFGPENVEFRRVELPVAPVEPVFSLDQLSGRECIRPIRAGDVIATSDLRLVPVVLKDQAVSVILRSGSLSIRMRGVAKADGVLGATVSVSNPDNGKTFFGKVVAPGQIEISLAVPR